MSLFFTDKKGLSPENIFLTLAVISCVVVLSSFFLVGVGNDYNVQINTTYAQTYNKTSEISNDLMNSIQMVKDAKWNVLGLIIALGYVAMNILVLMIYVPYNVASSMIYGTADLLGQMGIPIPNEMIALGILTVGVILLFLIIRWSKGGSYTT